MFLMRDEKEERKKQARSNKQTRQSIYILYTGLGCAVLNYTSLFIGQDFAVPEPVQGDSEQVMQRMRVLEDMEWLQTPLSVLSFSPPLPSLPPLSPSPLSLPPLPPPPLPSLLPLLPPQVMQRMGVLEDMRREWQQRRILEHYVQQAPPELFGVQTVG